MTTENKIDQLYGEMLAAIAAKTKQPNKTDWVETCYWIASNFWRLVKENLPADYFHSQQKSIEFFRNTKIKFTSQIQFFTILAEVLMFVPDEPEKQVDFWKEESKRLWRYCEKHREFVEYYESNAVYLDSVYFIKVREKWVPFPPLAFYDADINFCSTHDHLVRGLLAHKMFYDYAKTKLEELKYVE